MDRRTVILDAALVVLARDGMRALTHRAADAEAGIPPGSTSYYFRSRSALITGCVERLAEIDAAAEAPRPPGDLDALVDTLTSVFTGMVTARRLHTLARYELSLAAVRDPALRDALLAGGTAIRGLFAAALAGLGATDPAAGAEEVAATMDGFAFTVLLRGPADPAEAAALVHRALGHVVRAQPGVT